MAKYYVTDLRDFPAPGAPVDMPASALRLRDHLGAIVEAASAAPADTLLITWLGCQRERCSGRLHVRREAETAEIHWRCGACGEAGLISDWEGTAWDRSGAAVDDREGEPEHAGLGAGGATGDADDGGATATGEFGRRLIEAALARLGREPESLEELQTVLASVTAEYNRRPQAELGGLAPIQVQRLLAADWTAPGAALQLDERLELEALAAARELGNARIFLRALHDAGGTRATTAGNLNRKFVAEMVEALAWPRGFREDLYRYNKVVNEMDAFPLHLLRVLCELAGLVKRRKGAFSVTRRGAQLLAEGRAGELYSRLFHTQFREMNLAYLDRAPEVPGFQQTVAYSLYCFARVGDRWSRPDRLARQVILPVVLEEIPPAAYVDHAALILEARFLRPLERFGLAASREVPDKERHFPRYEYRKTPLYDRFLRFSLPSPA